MEPPSIKCSYFVLLIHVVDNCNFWQNVAFEPSANSKTTFPGQHARLHSTYYKTEGLDVGSALASFRFQRWTRFSSHWSYTSGLSNVAKQRQVSVRELSYLKTENRKAGILALPVA